MKMIWWVNKCLSSHGVMMFLTSWFKDSRFGLHGVPRVHLPEKIASLLVNETTSYSILKIMSTTIGPCEQRIEAAGFNNGTTLTQKAFHAHLHFPLLNYHDRAPIEIWSLDAPILRMESSALALSQRASPRTIENHEGIPLQQLRATSSRRDRVLTTPGRAFYV